MAKVYSYIRFSTPEQARGDSLRRQIEAAEAWCKERDLALDDTLSDLGLSAYDGANHTIGALRRFLDLVESGQIDRGSYLIVESLDRLSRETVIDAASRLLDLIRAGITVVTLSDGQEYSAERLRGDWTPLIISLAVMARAHDESRIKSERVGQAWRRKKEAARSEKKPLTRRCPEWLQLVDGRFIERPDRVAIVRRIFQETIEGAGRREIARRLNAEGIPPFRGKNGWQTSSIAKIIESRAVLGEYQPHSGTHKARNRKPDGDSISDYYPCIIDEQTFWRAQAAVQERRKDASGRKGNVVHLLQGLGRCGICRSPMHIVNKGRLPKGGVYLCCSSNLRNTGCTNSRRWRVENLEVAVLTGLGFLEVGAFAPLDEDASKATDKVAALQAELADAEERRKRLLALVETGDDAAVERFTAVANEVKALRKRLRKAEEEASKLAADPGLVRRLTDVADLTRRIESSYDPEGRRALRIRLSNLIRGLIERIICRPDIGAVMVLKPRLGPRFLAGVAPFACRGEKGIWTMLLEAEADKQTVDLFFSLSADTWEWKQD